MTPSPPFTPCIVIPTYDRAPWVSRAVRAALEQSYPHRVVLVVDDGSEDDTRGALAPLFHHPDLCYIRLERNGGTAQAKNLGLWLGGGYDAVTFHDSDDIPSPHKLLRQVRQLERPATPRSEFFDWAGLGLDPDEEVAVDVALGAHTFVRLDGTTRTISNRATLFDDFFPQVQEPLACEGDWILINSGLFRRRVFQHLGGFVDSVEEDRDLRNRILASGYKVAFVEEPLLTKIEMASSLTTDADTGYRGAERRRDRTRVWKTLERIRGGCRGEEARRALRSPFDLGELRLAEVTRPQILRPAADFPQTAASRRWSQSLDLSFVERSSVARSSTGRRPHRRPPIPGTCAEPGATGQDGTGQDATGQDGIGQNGTGRDGTGRDATGQNGIGQERPQPGLAQANTEQARRSEQVSA